MIAMFVHDSRNAGNGLFNGTMAASLGRRLGVHIARSRFEFDLICQLPEPRRLFDEIDVIGRSLAACMSRWSARLCCFLATATWRFWVCHRGEK